MNPLYSIVSFWIFVLHALWVFFILLLIESIETQDGIIYFKQDYTSFLAGR